MANSAWSGNTAGLASATSAGLVGTGAQTFAGDKTFNGTILPANGMTIPTTAVGQIYSGTYTPSISVTSGSVSGTPSLAQYIRIGRVVTVSGGISSFAFAALANVQFQLTVPIPRNSNFSITGNAGGALIWARGGVTVGSVVFYITAKTGFTDRVECYATSPSGTGTADLASYSFTYSLDF